MTGARRVAGPWKRAQAVGLMMWLAVWAAPAMAQSGQVTVTVTLSITAKATVDTAKVQAATKSAIQGLFASRANTLVTTGPDTARMHDRLSDGALFGASDAVVGFADASQLSRNRPALGQRMMGIGAGLGDAGSARLGDNTAPSASGLRENSPFDRFVRRMGVAGVGADDDSAGWSRWSGTSPVGLSPAYGRGEQSAHNLGWRFTGNAEDGAGRFAFSTSLSQMRASMAAEEQAKRTSIAEPASAFGGTTSVAKTAVKPTPFDAWIEGTASYFRSNSPDGRRDGHAAIVSVGADYLVRPGILFGLMGQLDWIADSATGALAQSRSGQGWMAGPYVSLRLWRDVYFDARALWGQASNTVDPLGAYNDRFDSTRVLASAKLSGDWAYGDFRFRPSTEVAWLKETAKTYTNAIGIDIEGQSYWLGRLSVGPEIAYPVRMADGANIELFLGVKTLWDFSKTEEITVAGTPVDPPNLRGRLEAGVTLRTPMGVSLRASGGYDGIGTSSYQAIQGRAQVVVPLQ